MSSAVKIMSAMDREIKQRSDKLVYFINTLVYGVREVKQRKNEKTRVSVKNPVIKEEIEKIFPEIGENFIAGINKVCGYDDDLKRGKHEEMDKFYLDPIFVDRAKTHLSCVYGLDDFYPELNNKIYYSSELASMGICFITHTWKMRGFLLATGGR